MDDWYQKLNERIYYNCKVYYNKYSQLTQMTEEQRGILGGLYQALNIVANEYVINIGYEHRKYRRLVTNMERLLGIGN